MKAVTADQMRRIEERTQAEFGISARELMHKAGVAVARQAVRRFSPRRVCIVCGKGNNGGDGFVAARELHTLGAAVDVIALSPADSLAETARWAFQQMRQAGLDSRGPEDLEQTLARADLVIDAVLGLGLRGPAHGAAAQAIERINRAAAPVLSVDLPSGLGEFPFPPEGACIAKAQVTVTIGLPKAALLTMPGAEYTGEVLVEPIQFPRPLLEDPDLDLNWLPPEELAAWIPPRPQDSNKGDFGRVGIVAGSAPFAGAAILMARGALRSGCGLVYIFTTRELNPIFKVALPEAVSVLVPSRDPDWLDDTSLEAICEKGATLDALAVGPGLGTAPPQKELVRQLIRRLPSTPLVLDADALTALAPEREEKLHLEGLGGRTDCVLTPHPGEMARLLGCGTRAADVQQNRVPLAREFADRTGTNLLLKGASTLLARPDGQVYVVPGGSSALAKGGTGDVLAGCVASLTAQGLEPWKAALLGASIHLEAGRHCGRRGSHGVFAGEVADALPVVMQQWGHATG